MIKFKFHKERIQVTPQFYLFTEFTDIWNWDKQPGKPKANKLLYFVFLLCDLSQENPLRDVASEQKESESLYRVYGDKLHQFTKKERELLEPAIECYSKYNETSEERILESFDEKATELREAIEKALPETFENVKDGVTTFVTNSSIITKGLKELDAVKKLKINVINSIRREAMSQRVRGAAVLSPLSKGNIPLPSEAEMYTQYEVNNVQRPSDYSEGVVEVAELGEAV